MRVKKLLAVGLWTAATGCASLGNPPGEAGSPFRALADFSHRVATPHVELYWSCRWDDPGRLRMDGMAHNSAHPQEVRYLEFDLVGVDRDGGIVSEAKGAVRDLLLGLNQVTPFSIDLRTTGKEVRFDLFYKYQFQEGDKVFPLAGPPVVGIRLASAFQSYVVRDACSKTQHRAR